MQIINSLHHETAKNSWTSGVVYDLHHRVRMYYVPACCDEWGALRPTPPPPGYAAPGARSPPLYIVHARKNAAGVFYARLLMCLWCSDCNAFTALYWFVNTSEK